MMRTTEANTSFLPQRTACSKLSSNHTTRNPPRRRLVVTALSTPELGNLVAQATTALATTNGTGAETLVASLTGETVPAPLRLIASDIASVATLTPTLPGLGRLALLWYSLFGRPAPLFGLLDYFVTGPLSENMGSRCVIT